MNANSTYRFNPCRIIFVFAFVCVSLLLNAQSANGEIIKLPFYVTDGVVSGNDGVVDTKAESTLAPIVNMFSYGPLEVSFSNAVWKNNKSVSASIEVKNGSNFTLKNSDPNVRIVSISWERSTTDAQLSCDSQFGSIAGSSVVTWTAPSADIQEVNISVKKNLMRISRFVIEYENLAHWINKIVVDYKGLDIVLSNASDENNYVEWNGDKLEGLVVKAKDKNGAVLINCPLLNTSGAVNSYGHLTSNGFEVRGENSQEAIRLANPRAKMVALSMKNPDDRGYDEWSYHRRFVSASSGSLYSVDNKSSLQTDWGNLEGVNEVVLTAENYTGASRGPTWKTLEIYYYEEEEPLERSEAPVIEGKAKFTESTVVTMKSEVPDTKIYYTSNGVDPDVKVLPNKSVQVGSDVKTYSGTGITITATTELRAVAVTEGHDVSSIVTAKFEKLSASAAPAISGEEKFETSTIVTITAPDKNATIYYTIDGSEPKVDYVNGNWVSSPNTMIYSDKVVLNNTATVKALSIAADLGPSAIMEKEFVQMPRANAPDLGVSGEQLFSDEAVVKVKNLPSGAKVFYTLDGSTPGFTEGPGGPVATGTTKISEQGEITVTESGTLIVVIWEQGKLPSDPISVKYTQTTAALTPVIEGEHHFVEPTTVTITASGEASIYYTTDGSDPIAGAAGACKLYSEPLILSATTTVKALAVEEGKLPSAIATRIYTRWERTSVPTIKGDFTFTDQTTVSFEGAPGAAIYYTLDNTDPGLLQFLKMALSLQSKAHTCIQAH